MGEIKNRIKMLKMKKALLFAALIVLLMGIVCAAEAPDNSIDSSSDATEVIDETNTVSEMDTTTKYDVNDNIPMEENTKNINKDTTNNSPNKNKKYTNIKEASPFDGWTALQTEVSFALNKNKDTTITLNKLFSYKNSATITWNNKKIVLTIDGAGQTIDGNGQRVFFIDKGSSLILKNITIKNSHTDNNAGAILTNGNLTITNSELYNNTANNIGGAIENGGNLTIKNSKLYNNTANFGGAIENRGNLTITNSELYNNTANSGGAIRNLRTLTITNNTILHNNNAKDIGGAINSNGTLTITNNTILHNNTSTYGGAITNWDTLTITNSELHNNIAKLKGGAIDNYKKQYFDVIGCNFTQNYALEGGAISSVGYLNATCNKFIENTANNKETIDLNSQWDRKFYNNQYESTDISFKEVKLSLKDDKESFLLGEDLLLNLDIELEHPRYYDDDIIERLNKTIYLDGVENATTKQINFTLSNLELGTHSVYFITNNKESKTVTFTIKKGESEISTDKESYEYYDGVKDTVTFDISDENSKEGTIDISLKNDEKNTKLLSYYNVKDGFQIPVEALIGALKNIYEDLDSKYTINVTYNSNSIYVDTSSTEFTLNIIKQRNTTIIYDILNNTEGNVQINITIIDAVNHSIIEYSDISITGDINKNTTSGVLVDNTLTAEDYAYKLYVHYNGTENYLPSDVTIEFTVEIDKDAKIAELEKQVTNLTEKLNASNKKIKELESDLKDANEKISSMESDLKNANKNIENLETQLKDANNNISKLQTDLENAYKNVDNLEAQLKDANNNVKNLEAQLKDANNNIKNLESQLKDAKAEVESLTNINNQLNKQLNDANSQIDNLDNKVNNLTGQIDEKENEINKLQNTINKLTEELNRANSEIDRLNEYIDELLNKTTLNTTITVNPIKSSVGSIVNLSANIIDENALPVTGGKAVFKVNGITLKDENNNVIYAPVKDGFASITYKVQSVCMKNTTTVQAVYSGCEKYSSSRTNASGVLDISEGIAKITLEKSALNTKAGQTITLRAKITDSTGERINTGKAVFKLNGITLKDENGEVRYANVVDGEAVIDYTIPAVYSAKTYTLTAVYGGRYYERAQTSGTLTLEKKYVNINTASISTNNKKTSIRATITDETGSLLVCSTQLAIKINGKTVLNGVNSTNGLIDVSFVTTLRPGMYELLIISGENSLYQTGKMTTVLKIE